ncbi:MAG TPA: four-carbon acid sugar kinase family protein [Rubrivivax sp.]|nr:four-carbon acid sugar kinase family protein [Rubrivivax sp.]
MTLKLGCIADDFTGATDLANNLVRAGMRVVQTIGVPAAPVTGVDAVVVALKSRTAPVAEAVADSLAAARWLRAQGAAQIYFKVCSTFDSTPAGNIGPVAEALLADAGGDFALVTPAFPENGRTVYKGHLFVGDLLLSDSPMRHHPLTPMTDANLVRVLQAQVPRSPVGLIEHRHVAAGAAAVAERIGVLRREGVRLAIADALDDADLHVLAQATRGLKLVVAGSGLAIGIPTLHGLAPAATAAQLPPASASRAIVSGSCSAATNAQVAHFLAAGGAGFELLPLRLADGVDMAQEALDWAAARLAQDPARPLLVYATAPPATVQAVQARLGAERAGALVEQALARVAQGLVGLGVRQLVLAGGETSGACIAALGIAQLRIGPQIDPGVPWCFAQAGPAALHLALKSGNFGGPDFFTRAFTLL